MVKEKIDALNFRRRLKRQRGEDEKFRMVGGDESGEGWRYGKGDYGIATLVGMKPDSWTREVYKLLGVEFSIQKMIEELLLKSKERPIIVFDFGGGPGLSWCRLAKHYEQEVLSGNLLFVVSNIERNYDVLAAVYSENLNLSEEERKLIIEANNRKLVQYIEAELAGADRKGVRSLRQYKIRLGNREITLFGNVDIVHTRMSLIHSEVPEIHYPRLFELLSEHGIYIDTTFNSKIPAVPADEIDMNWNMGEKAEFVFESYRYVMEDMGFESIKESEGGEQRGVRLWATVLRRKGPAWPQVVVD